MERPEAALLIAQLNKISKQLYSYIVLEQDSLVKSICHEEYDFPSITRRLRSYIQKDSDPILYRQFLKFTETGPIVTYASSVSDFKVAKCLMEMVETVNALRQMAIMIDSKDKPNECLDDALNNEVILELLARARNAGYLLEDFAAAPSTKMFELKLIASAIIGIANLQPRDSWCHFNRLWNISRKSLGAVAIPLTKGSEIYRVAQLYPEYNVMQTFKKDNAKPVFKSPFTPEQAEFLATMLKKKKYLDKATSNDVFLAVQGLSAVPPMMINWVGSAFSLAYFIRTVYNDLNLKIWTLTGYWFKVNGKPINVQSYKSKVAVLRQHADRYDFIPELDGIIQNAMNITRTK